MVTLKIFLVDPSLKDALRTLVSEQTYDDLDSDSIQGIQKLESENIIGHLPSRKKIELVGTDEMIEQIWGVYNDTGLNTMTEKYFWGKTK